MSGLHRRQDVWITVENRVKISSSTSLRADRKADTSIPNAAALAMLLFSRVNMSNSSRWAISLSSTLSLYFDCTSDPFRNTQEFNDLGLVRVHKRIMAVVVAGDAVGLPGAGGSTERRCVRSAATLEPTAAVVVTVRAAASRIRESGTGE